MSDIIELSAATMGCCGPIVTINEAEATAISDDFDVFAHPIRVQLLAMLAQSGDSVCVCDLETAVRVKQPTVSYHLKLLREMGLVESERKGPWAYYRINRERLQALQKRIADHLFAWQA